MVLMPVKVKTKKGGKKGKKRGGLYPQYASLPIGSEMVLGGKRMRHMGGGFFSDVWSGIKNVASKALPAIGNLANEALKKSGVVSTGLSMIPGVGPVASMLARSQGYGRKRGGKNTFKAIKG